ncbi:MAG: hypothetical protein WC813_04580 [Patescibacteria group bacterium]|jgi:hypothetical protein
MKKILVGFLGLLLVGAGCLPIANKPVDGKWQLAFDLPKGWVMVTPYEASGEGKIKPVNEAVRRNDTEVYLQSTDKPICFTSGGPCAEGSVTEGTLISASQLDSHRTLPKEREDLKNGLSRVKLCEAGGECQIGNQGNYTYYLETEKGNFTFSYGGDAQDVESIIKSAKVVTHYTDLPTVEVK